MSGPTDRGPGAPPDRVLERALSQAVRTPLHSMLGFLELLAISGLDGEQRRLHEELITSAEDLLSGTDRIMWLIRVQGGHYAPRPARVHLAAFAHEVAAASTGAVSVVVAPDAAPHLDADLAALHQLITELLSNATVHGSSPVVLAVSPATGRPDAVRIIVSDGGAGLPPGARAAIVAGVADGRLPEGGGIGLLLVRRLAALLGGTVEVLPSPIGTQLALTLPLASSVAPMATPAPPTPSRAAGPVRPLRVLLVEDNATNRLLAQRQLTRLGHTMVDVATGEAGVRAVLDDATAAIDVVLMDRHLPDIDGCEATRRIRAGLPAGRRRLPVIAVTADATAESRAACTAAGMDEVLTKPVDLQQLDGALARAAAAIDDGPEAGAPAPDPWTPPALRALVARLDGDVHAAAELVTTYLGELPGRRLRIQASLRRGECRAVLAAAESLQTSSDSVGATGVSGVCAALGAAAAAEDLPAARAFLPSLVLHCDRFAADFSGFSDASTVTAALA